MIPLIRKRFDSKLMKFNLVDLYYYSFLSTFAIIIFVNLIPSDWVVITRIFVIFSAILSLFLLNNINAVLYVLLLYIFLLIYTLYPLITYDLNIEYLVNNTRYAIYFILLFGLVNIIRLISLDRLLYSMSKIFIVKLILVGIISLNMNFGAEWFVGYILNDIDLVVHELFGVYRVLDVTLFLFPLVFIYTKSKKNSTKVMIHTLLLFNIMSSITVGIIFSYIIVMFLKFKFIRKALFLLIMISIFIFYDYFLGLYENFLIVKSVSVEVKLNQFLFLIDNVSLWGQGLGTLITIDGRADSMLENVFIYWSIVYGLIGSIFMIMFFVLFPFSICYRFKKEFSVSVLFYMHLSVLLVSITNPFLESVIGIMPMMIIVSYFFSKKYFEQVQHRAYLL